MQNSAARRIDQETSLNYQNVTYTYPKEFMQEVHELNPGRTFRTLAVSWAA